MIISHVPKNIGAIHLEASNVRSVQLGKEKWRHVGSVRPVDEVDFNYLKEVEKELTSKAIVGKTIFRTAAVSAVQIHNVREFAKWTYQTYKVCKWCKMVSSPPYFW